MQAKDIKATAKLSVPSVDVFDAVVEVALGQTEDSSKKAKDVNEVREQQQHAAAGSEHADPATVTAATAVTGAKEQVAGASEDQVVAGAGAGVKARAPRALELLAPAKDLAVGQAAIVAGADAVYIGGPSFGARAAAGNSMEDLAVLCAFAHRFGARVYLTVNTLLYDAELAEVERLVGQARDVGVDALIIQDAALLGMDSLEQMEIHASTQMNIDSLAKVDFCRAWHFSQIVIPREFSLEQIREFCQSRPDTRFEVFVAGAMCVSVSGICHISEMMTGRSANRGACAQICRLPMTLYQRQSSRRDCGAAGGVASGACGAAQGAARGGAGAANAAAVTVKEIAHGHLLSMKDNLRLAQLEDLVLAGAVSFKIEGRLKDRDYVVNQVSAFRERLDQIIDKYPERYKRASLGVCHHGFKPDLCKTFNRGFTSAYLQGDNSALVDARTPKNLGEELGVVQGIKVLNSHSRTQGLESRQGPKQNQNRSKSQNQRQGPWQQQGRNYGRNHCRKQGRDLVSAKAPSAVADTAMGTGANAFASMALGESSCCIALQVKTACTLSNGDSFTFFTPQAELTGFRVNRISALDDSKGSTSTAANVAKGTQGAKGAKGVKGTRTGAGAAHVMAKHGQKPVLCSGKETESSKAAHGVTVPAGATVYLYVPKAVEGLMVGATLYRNVDTLFIKELNMPQAITRQMPLKALIAVSSTAFSISFIDAYGRSGSQSLALPFVAADPASANTSAGNGSNGSGQEALQTPAAYNRTITVAIATAATMGTAEQGTDGAERSGELAPLKPEVMVAKLTKLGSPYVSLSAEDISLEGDLALAKLPLSAFNQLRRQAFAAYEQAISLTRTQALALGAPYLDSPDGTSVTLYQKPVNDDRTKLSYPETVLDKRLLLNHCTQAFYQHGGVLPVREPKAQKSTAAQTNVANTGVSSVSGVAIAGENAESTVSTLPIVSTEPTATFTASSANTATNDIAFASVTDSANDTAPAMATAPVRAVTKDEQAAASAKAKAKKAVVVTSPLAPPAALVSKAVMTCRHCLIKEHAVCHKDGGKTSGYFLRIGKYDFDIVTDCRKCLMHLVPHQEHREQDEQD